LSVRPLPVPEEVKNRLNPFTVSSSGIKNAPRRYPYYFHFTIHLDGRPSVFSLQGSILQAGREAMLLFINIPLLFFHYQVTHLTESLVCSHLLPAYRKARAYPLFCNST
jgi:hypothetical protein